MVIYFTWQQQKALQFFSGFLIEEKPSQELQKIQHNSYVFGDGKTLCTSATPKKGNAPVTANKP